jgi:hypothetical protein
MDWLIGDVLAGAVELVTVVMIVWGTTAIVVRHARRIVGQLRGRRA